MVKDEIWDVAFSIKEMAKYKGKGFVDKLGGALKRGGELEAFTKPLRDTMARKRVQEKHIVNGLGQKTHSIPLRDYIRTMQNPSMREGFMANDSDVMRFLNRNNPDWVHR